jgi:tetratricopeptide (TPR) repeat protein
MRIMIAVLLAAALVIASLCGLSCPVAFAAAPEAIASLTEKLDSWDVDAAWAGAKGLLDKEPQDVRLLELASQAAFYQGNYGEALKLAKSAAELGGQDEAKKSMALFLEATVEVIGSLKTYETPHFRISLDERLDGILAGYLGEALEKSYQLMAQRYGFDSKEKIRIEVLPDTKAFYYVTSLSARDIEVAGAVGITQFNKLMILSPRALVYGYRFLDSACHEFVHYVIMKLTSNKAPIWFHEGLASYEEAGWRARSTYLSAVFQTLLARALAEGRLITFERMEPGLVKLDTPDEVQLAYAESATAIDFIVGHGGFPAVREIMTQMGRSDRKGAGDAIKSIMSLTLEEFDTKWKEDLQTKGLKEVPGVAPHRFKVKEGRADEERLDMGEIKSMVARNRAHLGDLLKERGRTEAAILEYRRALAEAGDSVPILNRLSEVLIPLARYDEALKLLEHARDLAPDHPSAYAGLGRIYLRRGDPEKAQNALQNSTQVSPFNPEVHLDLAEVYEKLGNREAASKEKEIYNKLSK